MKKNYFMLAATTMLFAACAQNDVVNELAQESAQQAISFETFANKQTRAANEAENSNVTDINALSGHHDNYVVWGYKNTHTGYVFGTSTTEGENVNSDNTYTNTKYWDKAASKYEFYAAAPNNGKWVLNANTENQADDYFTYENFVLTGKSLEATTLETSFKSVSAADCDLMIASAEPVTIIPSTTVQLKFNHILSRLNITVKKGSHIEDTDVLKLTSISVNNLVKNGTFTESAAVKAGTTTRWSTAAPIKYDIDGNDLSEVTTTAQYVFQALVIPQFVEYEAPKRDGTDINEETSAPYIVLNYTIDDEPYKAVYNLAKAFGSTSDPIAFNEGYQNTLNITIDAEEIKFTADAFVWDTDSKDFTID